MDSSFEQMYIEMIQEMYGACSVLMTEFGFMQYMIKNDKIVIMETFIKREHRAGAQAYRKMANMVCDIGRANDCKYLMGKVQGSNPNKDAVIACYAFYKMKHYCNEGHDMWFSKEL